MTDWSRVFAEALPYASFLEQFANASQQDRWQAMHSRISLTVEEAGNLLSVLTPNARSLSGGHLVRRLR